MTDAVKPSRWQEKDFITRNSYDNLEKQEYRLMMLATLFGAIENDTPLGWVDFKAMSDMLNEAASTICEVISNAALMSDSLPFAGKENET